MGLGASHYSTRLAVHTRASLLFYPAAAAAAAAADNYYVCVTCHALLRSRPITQMCRTRSIQLKQMEDR